MLCIKCHDDKLETEFRKGRKQCKECENKRSREYYKENRVQLLEKVRKPPKVTPTTCTTCNVILNDNNKREGRFRCCDCENKRRREEYYDKIKDKINEDRRTKYIKKRPPKTPTKICKDCKIELPNDQFRVHRRVSLRVCRKCENSRTIEYYRNNPNKRREYHTKNKDKLNDYRKQKYQTDYSFRFVSLLRKRVNSCVRGKKQGLHTLDILGCSRIIFLIWIDSNFYGDISWLNYGTYWHIDHIKPCASFNFLQESHIKECFHWSNMRPCLATENLIKSNRIDSELIDTFKKNAIIFMDTILNHETLITTLKEKFLRGSRLAAEPDSNNIRE